MRTGESMKNRQHKGQNNKGQNKQGQKDNNDPQNTTQKTKHPTKIKSQTTNQEQETNTQTKSRVEHPTKIKSQTPNQDQELLSGSEALHVSYYLFMSILLMKSPLSPRGLH
jgi:hypothetical protein